MVQVEPSDSSSLNVKSISVSQSPTAVPINDQFLGVQASIASNACSFSAVSCPNVATALTV